MNQEQNLSNVPPNNDSPGEPLSDRPLKAVRKETLDLILEMLSKHRPERPQSSSPPMKARPPEVKPVFQRVDEGMYQIWILNEQGQRQHKIEGHGCVTEQDYQDYLAMMVRASGGKAKGELVRVESHLNNDAPNLPSPEDVTPPATPRKRLTP